MIKTRAGSAKTLLLLCAILLIILTFISRRFRDAPTEKQFSELSERATTTDASQSTTTTTSTITMLNESDTIIEVIDNMNSSSVTVAGRIAAKIPSTLVEPSSSMLEMACKFPIISRMEPNLRGYVHLFRDVICEKRMPNLASLSFDEHKLTIHNELEPYRQMKVPAFKCTYQGIDGGLYPNATVINWIGEEVEAPEDVEIVVPYDQFVVRCRNQSLVSVVNGEERLNDSIIYERAFAGFSKITSEKFLNRSASNPKAPSLAILVLDSVARNQFLRHMPRTVEFMRRIGFEWLNGYNKVGDNSAVNLLPILAGKSILPRVGGDSSEVIAEKALVDLEKTRFLWDIMRERNCVTLFNDDILDIHRGLFHYPPEKFTGFRRMPTDFYFRAYHLFNPKYMFYPQPAGGQCMKTGQMTTNEYLDIWEKYSTHFKDKCHFSFNFFTELTHDDGNNLGAIDDRLRTSLERFAANGVLESTALVIMGDHGNRISTMQYTYVGRIEERAPLFALYTPKKFRDAFPQKWANFKWNTNRLTSNFDVHQTLKNMLDVNRINDKDGRGIDLFAERVAETRTCEDAGVAENFCLCMEYRNISRMTRTSKEYAVVENLLRNYTQTLRCFNTTKFRIVEDRIRPMAINQMVRHGLRDAAE